MTNPGPLTKQIAASTEDVQALLRDNRHLSIAFLDHRMRDLEEDVRRRFRELGCPCKTVVEAMAAIAKLEGRLDQAKIKFREMREELDQVKAERNTRSANTDTTA